MNTICVFCECFGQNFFFSRRHVFFTCIMCELKRRLHWTVCFCFEFIILDFIIFTFQILRRLLIGHLKHLLHNYWKNESNKNGNSFSIIPPSISSHVISFGAHILPNSFIISVWQQSHIANDSDKHGMPLQKLSRKKVGQICIEICHWARPITTANFPGKYYD